MFVDFFSRRKTQILDHLGVPAVDGFHIDLHDSVLRISELCRVMFVDLQCDLVAMV